jgi:hypothetical protein
MSSIARAGPANLPESAAKLHAEFYAFKELCEENKIPWKIEEEEMKLGLSGISTALKNLEKLQSGGIAAGNWTRPDSWDQKCRDVYSLIV